MTILYVQVTRPEIIYDEMFSDNELLHDGLVEFCEKENINPIYIDRNIAILEKELIVAVDNALIDGL